VQVIDWRLPTAAHHMQANTSSLWTSRRVWPLDIRRRALGHPRWLSSGKCLGLTLRRVPGSPRLPCRDRRSAVPAARMCPIIDPGFKQIPDSQLICKRWNCDLCMPRSSNLIVFSSSDRIVVHGGLSSCEFAEHFGENYLFCSCRVLVL